MNDEHPLTTLIIEENLTNRILAERIGICPDYLSAIRHGRRLPSPSLMLRICRICKKSQDELFPDYKERRRETLARYRRIKQPAKVSTISKKQVKKAIEKVRDRGGRNENKSI